MSPRDVHPLSRNRRAFGTLGSQQHRRLRKCTVQHRKHTLHSRVSRTHRVERLRAGQQDVTIGEVQRAGESVMAKMMRHWPDPSTVYVHFKNVAKRLLDEQNALTIV